MNTILLTLRQHKYLTSVFIITMIVNVIAFTTGLLRPELMLDKVVHLLLPATGAPLIYAYLVNIKVFPEVQTTLGIILLILLVGTGAEAFWEVIEFAIDSFFGATMQHSQTDTMLDIIMAMVGSGAGALWFVFRKKS